MKKFLIFSIVSLLCISLISCDSVKEITAEAKLDTMLNKAARNGTYSEFGEIEFSYDHQGISDKKICIAIADCQDLDFIEDTEKADELMNALVTDILAPCKKGYEKSGFDLLLLFIDCNGYVRLVSNEENRDSALLLVNSNYIPYSEEIINFIAEY